MIIHWSSNSVNIALFSTIALDNYIIHIIYLLFFHLQSLSNTGEGYLLISTVPNNEPVPAQWHCT